MVQEVLIKIFEMICTSSSAYVVLLIILVMYEEIQLSYLQLSTQEATEARSFLRCTWELYQVMN
eukprot:snap_masked-scaffold_52-processed-gene-1.76-mRNA-1 protein AED:1.00 eAED:1.00 QI:0/0/0/0/1/1/2/0/63